MNELEEAIKYLKESVLIYKKLLADNLARYLTDSIKAKEKYKKLLADNLARYLNDSIKAKEKANTDLEDLNIGWQLELEKKDKMIDLMAEELQKHIFVLYDGDTIISKKGIIQHYERKAKDGRL